MWLETSCIFCSSWNRELVIHPSTHKNFNRRFECSYFWTFCSRIVRVLNNCPEKRINQRFLSNASLATSFELSFVQDILLKLRQQCHCSSTTLLFYHMSFFYFLHRDWLESEKYLHRAMWLSSVPWYKYCDIRTLCSFWCDNTATAPCSVKRQHCAQQHDISYQCDSTSVVEWSNMLAYSRSSPACQTGSKQCTKLYTHVYKTKVIDEWPKQKFSNIDFGNALS